MQCFLLRMGQNRVSSATAHRLAMQCADQMMSQIMAVSRMLPIIGDEEGGRN